MEKLEIEGPSRKRRRIERLVRIQDNADEKNPASKPIQVLETTKEGVNSDLSERLKAFLPQIEKANADLDEESGGLEDVDEDEEHIEMNLGLGVLKENHDDSSEDDSDEDDDSEEEGNVINKLLNPDFEALGAGVMQAINELSSNDEDIDYDDIEAVERKLYAYEDDFTSEEDADMKLARKSKKS